MYLIHKAKKVKKCHHQNPDDGKQPKMFGLNFFNFTIFNFLTFFSLVYEIHFIKRTLWTIMNNNNNINTTINA